MQPSGLTRKIIEVRHDLEEDCCSRETPRAGLQETVGQLFFVSGNKLRAIPAKHKLFNLESPSFSEHFRLPRR
jgi:hypothetical protein